MSREYGARGEGQTRVAAAVHFLGARVQCKHTVGELAAQRWHRLRAGTIAAPQVHLRFELLLKFRLEE